MGVYIYVINTSTYIFISIMYVCICLCIYDINTPLKKLTLCHILPGGRVGKYHI